MKPLDADADTLAALGQRAKKQLRARLSATRRALPTAAVQARSAFEQAARIAGEQAGANSACGDDQPVCWRDLAASAWMELGHFEVDQRRAGAARQAFDQARRQAAEPGLKGDAQRCYAAAKLPCRA